MQMVKKIVGGFFLLIILLVIFAPKEQIYYLLEKKLYKEGVVISNEKIKDKLYGISIEDADIYLQGIKIAHVKSIDLDILFLYNKLSIHSLKAEDGVEDMIPKSIDNLSATLSIIKPYMVEIEGVGSFGEIKGGLYFSTQKLILRFQNTKKDIKMFRKFLKKDKEGLFYEKYFK